MGKTLAIAALLASIAFACGVGGCACGPCATGAATGNASLPSWRDSSSRDRILAFIDRVTDPSSPDYVPADQRIAVFDNDGTLWAERPVYFQFYFAMDRAREMAADHPEWRTTEPFRSAIDGDIAGVLAAGEPGINELLIATHTGMSPDAFERIVGEWLQTARHPTTGRPFTEMTYAPMVELLDALRASGFEVFIVTGGGVSFVRAFSEEAYGVPRHMVVGSRFAVTLDESVDPPALVRRPKLDAFNDKAEKPAGIEQFIGRRPILAVGNSDGDYQMLRWTTAGAGPRLGVLVHHTDAEREWAYDRDSKVGKLERGLDEASMRGWVLIDMAEDWATVFE